jgi:vitamin B12 transporter
LRYLIVTFSFLINFLYGQKNITIQEVTIFENRQPQTLLKKSNKNGASINTEALREKPNVDLINALTYTAGIELSQRNQQGAQADLSISGGTFDQSLVMINGYKVNDLQTGHHVMNLPFSIAAIKNIQVYRGTQSRSYGAGPLTGVMHIDVSPNEKNGIWMQGSIQGNAINSEESQKYLHRNWMAGFHFGDSKNRYLLSLSHDKGEGYRFNSASHRNTVTFSSQHQFNENNKLSILASGLIQDFGANGFYAPPFDSFSQENIQTALIGVTYQSKILGWNSILRSYFRTHRDQYILRNFQPNFYNNKHLGNVFGLEHHVSKNNLLGTFGAGIDYRHEQIESNNLGNHTRKNAGLFLEQKWNLLKKLDASTGIYANYNSDFGVHFFPGAEMGYWISNPLKVYVSSEFGMRNPTFTDLHYSDRANIGNPNLIAEKGATHTFGVKWNSNFGFFQTALFYRHIDNMIVWIDTDSSSRRLWQPQNLRKMETIGLQTEFNSKRIALSTNLGIQFQSSYQNLHFVQNLDGTKNSLQALKHQWINQIHFDIYKKIQCQLNFRFLEHFDSQSYLLLDSRVSYCLNKFTFFINLNNISNTTYYNVNQINMPQRNFTLGIQFSDFK